jgi:hypothetical protein
VPLLYHCFILCYSKSTQHTAAKQFLNPLAPELNPSAQRCLTRFFTGDFASLTCISLMYAWKTNKCNNYWYGRPGHATDDNIIWHMRLACWITKATNTHSEYVIRIAFPLQQWLHERASMLRYTYIACLVLIFDIHKIWGSKVWASSAGMMQEDQ